MATENSLGIQPDSVLGFPFLEFTDPAGAEVSNERLYQMFITLPPKQRALLDNSQALLFDGQGLMDMVRRIVRRNGSKMGLTIDPFQMTPEAIQVLAEYGEPYIGRLLPPAVLMERGECSWNTLRAIKKPGLAYVEGLALPPVGRIMHHVWCATGERVLDKKRNKLTRLAEDYTWARADYARYFGIWLDKEAFIELTAICLHKMVNGMDPTTDTVGFMHHKIWCPEIRKVFEENAKRQRV